MGEKTALVVKSNRMIEAGVRLTMTEQQIILYSIAQARETQKGLSDADFVTITALEFAAQFGTPEATVYRDLSAAVDTFFERRFLLHGIDPATGKPDILKMRWVSAIKYVPDAGLIRLRFAPDAIPYITRLEKEFTSYRIAKISNLSSVHAVRVYELLIQYLPLGKRTFEIVKLKWMLGISELEYPRIVDLKLRVIEVAVKQINAHTDITISYTQRKTGRNVTHFEFSIALKTDATPKKPKIDAAYLQKHAYPGESAATARARLKAKLKAKPTPTPAPTVPPDASPMPSREAVSGYIKDAQAILKPRLAFAQTPAPTAP